MASTKTQTHFKVAGLRKEINTEMQTLLNAVKGFCEPNAELDQTLEQEPNEDYSIGLKASHFLVIRKSYARIDELCNRVVQITKEEAERRIIV